MTDAGESGVGVSGAGKRIALVSSVPVFPTTEGNRRRILNLGRALRRLGHEVHFVFLPSRTQAGLDMAAHAAEFGAGRVSALARPAPDVAAFTARRALAKLTRGARRLLGRADAFHLGLDELYQPAFTRQLAALHARHGFDAAILSYVFNTRAFDAFPRAVLRVLDTHDSFADRHLAVPGARGERDYWFSVPDATELTGFRRADTVLAIQEEEAASFARRLGPAPPRVATVSHIVEIAPPLERFDGVGGVFIGSANGPNIASIRHFVAEILPPILAAVPEFRLHVVGSISAHVGDAPGVVRRGRVDDLGQVWRDGPLSLNPMTAGTGINIKLLDAMAAGVGTVSTRLGARGLGADFADGVAITPDGDPRAFAEAVIALARDEGARRALGARAHAAAKAWNARQLAALSAALEP